MGRKRSEKPRLHSASGKAFIELGGKRIYLESAYGTKAAEQEYNRLYGQWLANDSKPPPSKDTEVSAITCGELALRYLDWAEKYHIPNEGEPTVEYDHCRQAVSFLTKHFMDVPAVKFTALSLEFLQEKLAEHKAKNRAGCYARPTIRKYINIIRDVFRRGVKYHGVPAEIHYALLSHEHLKRGKTKAHEHRKPKSVPDDIVEQTLPHMTPIIADMVRVQRFTGCRPKEVRIMRSCDIDRETYVDVWIYTPSTHKTENVSGEESPIAIGRKAQAILMAYLIDKEDSPEAYLFSPADSVHLQNVDKRHKRKTLNKSGQVQPSQRNRKKDNPKKVPGDHYTKSSYYQGIARACKKAGVPRWFPYQLRKSKAVEVRKKDGRDAAQAVMRHKNFKTTETFYAPAEFEKAVEFARKYG
jgi:integrase